MQIRATDEARRIRRERRRRVRVLRSAAPPLTLPQASEIAEKLSRSFGEVTVDGTGERPVVHARRHNLWREHRSLSARKAE